MRSRDCFDEFQPDFTYTFFGESEAIYGFKDLKINIFFSAMTLRPYICIEYSEKERAVTPVKAVIEPLLESMFEGVQMPLAQEGKLWTSSLEQFHQWVEEDQKRGFKPLGDKVYEYTRPDAVSSTFEIYECTFETPGFEEFHRRIQVFLLWYIEGASFIEPDHRWKIYFIWERKADGEFGIIGYWTTYAFYLFPDKVRMRISQALVFPPYQGKGHGGIMYRYLYDMFMTDDRVVDMTVEDPSESFSDLRYKNDLRVLVKNKVLADSIKDDAFIPPTAEQITEVRLRYKLDKYHIIPLLETYFLKLIKRNHPEMYKSYRIWVKKRIFRKNEEALATMPEEMVKQKLDETFCNVEEDYRRVLNLL